MQETEVKPELRIAIIGSAPSSVRLAPYHDPSWVIWGCSPGAYGIVPAGRSDMWWELHKYEPGQPWFSPEYCQFLNSHKSVMVAEAVPQIPNGNVLPAQELVAKYSPYFFTSSIAWMMAMAIEAGATKIGLWGVDMAATEEYEIQRAGLHYFALEAAKRGIEVGVPQESDLFRPRFLYGVDECTHFHIKLRARRNELLMRQQDAQRREAEARDEATFMRGAIDDLNYHFQTWPDKTNWVAPPALAAPQPVKPAVFEPRIYTSPVVITNNDQPIQVVNG